MVTCTWSTLIKFSYKHNYIFIRAAVCMKLYENWINGHLYMVNTDPVLIYITIFSSEQLYV